MPLKEKEKTTPKGETAVDRITNHCRGLIESRRLKPGDLMPSSNDLAAQFKVSRASADTAVRRLRDLGLVVNGPKGREVAEQPAPTSLALTYPEGLNEDQRALWARGIRVEADRLAYTITLSENAMKAVVTVEG